MSSRRIAASFALLVLAGCPKKTDAPADATAQSDAGDASITTVTTPSAAVSVDVVSNASMAWDAGPSVVAEGEVDGAALRKRTHGRLDKDQSPVTMLSGGTPRELGERLCKTVVPTRPKETPILIKPNMGGFDWFKDPEKTGGDDGVRGRTTDPEFVRGIVRCLKARGHTKITVAEGWGATPADWRRLIKVGGYEAMTREENVPLVAMDDDGIFDVEGDKPGKPLKVTGMEKSHSPTLLMPKILAEHLQHGLFISAPKVKAHRFGVVSVSIKGGQGTVMLSDASPAYKQKGRMHKELMPALGLKDVEARKKAYVDALEIFAERMVDQLEVAGPHVVLAEGAPAMGGDGFGKRWPSPESVAIGGTNPILVDRVAAAYLGLWDNTDLARELGGHKTSPLITAAAKRFQVDLGSPVIEGDGAALMSKKRPVHFVAMSGFQIHSEDTQPEKVPGGVTTKTEDVGERPALRAKHVETIVVDARIDEAWKTAPIATFDTDWSGAKTETSTHVRVAWNKSMLAVLFELEGANVNVDASRPIATERAKLYEEDCVEIFLAPDPTKKERYAEIEVGPLGHFLDLWVERDTKKSDVEWSSKPEIATKVDREKKKVTIEFAVRAPEIVSALAKGKKLPVAFYRMEGKGKRQYLAWSPTKTARPNFHVPEAFGTLVLE